VGHRRPQATVVPLAKAGEIVGSFLDVGCGTGESALSLAALGHEVLGVDASPAAEPPGRYFMLCWSKRNH
jgi:predicted RNA methylase